ncbi:MAG: gamma-glutamyltransferase family protein [Chloroflexi bacterium]|nr:gamma-glutamyltransferase family protein [Chloroflexota bacterium]
MHSELNPRYISRRSTVYAARGMVATSQPLAAQAGLLILMQGGNAADAAVATAAALNVTEPCSTGLGGDCFMLFYDAATRSVSALNGSGRAPQSLNFDALAADGFVKELPPFHAHTVTVPGACAGWVDTVERFGSLPLSDILAPAIRLAQEGFPVAPLTAYFWGRGAERQLGNSAGGQELLINGRAPGAGEVFSNPTLGKVLQSIAETGKEDFYRGWIAEAIVSTVQDHGGLMSLDDLAHHTSTWEEPISTIYDGVRLYECPPNGQGLTALLALNILSQFDLPENPLSVERLHLVIEALRLAFADTRWFVADPVHNPAPLDELLSAAYAAERAKLINREQATIDQITGVPVAGSDTVYLTVVDGEGNACSFINSNYMGFGTGIVPSGTGFSLQNRGHGFSLNPNHPNALTPGKRPYHTIIPAMATRESDGSLFASFGVMGGFMQPQGHLQVLLSLVADGLSPQDALDQPRVCIEDGRAGGRTALEEGIPVAVMAQLAAMGHPVRPASGQSRAIFGRGQIILRDPVSGVLAGGSDPRADGLAIGF